MKVMYQLTDDTTITRLADGASIPACTGNRDYRDYLQWLADGNTPEPAPSQDAEALADAARVQRDSLLRGCDWTQIPDTPLTADQRAAWCTYREALRNVPEQEGFPGSITWPIAPDAAAA